MRVVAWPCDVNRVGLMESFGLALRELVQRLGRDKEFSIGTVWISERQDFDKPVDVFVNLADITEHPAFTLVLSRAKWRSNELTAVLSSVDRKWPAYGWKAEKSTVNIFSGEKIELTVGMEGQEKHLRLMKKHCEELDRTRAEEKEVERAKRVEGIRAEEAQADQSAQNSRAQAAEAPIASVEKKKPLVSILRKKFGPR